ncbi:MAG: hypothetical protein WAU28_01180 [Candidatus Moraniibacteriota bacterium]
MFKNVLDNFREKGYGHILYALLIETMLLILLSFAGLFTLETILPGLISGRFVIGKLIVVVTLLFFFTAFLGRSLGISLPITISSSLRTLLILMGLWALGILTISLLAFPTWSIPIFLLSFGAIAYLTFKEFKK